MPADADKWAINITQHLAANLEVAGFATTVVPKMTAELRRDLLRKQDFDVDVDRIPLEHDPDALRPLLHSVYAEQDGRYTSFGFADLAVDDLLDTQRTQSHERGHVVADLLPEIGARQPFVPVAVPDDIAAVRTDRFVGWNAAGIEDPRRYLGLSHREDKRADALEVSRHRRSHNAQSRPADRQIPRTGNGHRAALRTARAMDRRRSPAAAGKRLGMARWRPD